MLLEEKKPRILWALLDSQGASAGYMYEEEDYAVQIDLNCAEHRVAETIDFLLSKLLVMVDRTLIVVVS